MTQAKSSYVPGDRVIIRIPLDFKQKEQPEIIVNSLMIRCNGYIGVIRRRCYADRPLYDVACRGFSFRYHQDWLQPVPKLQIKNVRSII